VDVADATGEAELASLHGLLESGPERWELVRRAGEREGRPVEESDFGPAVPEPRRILCLGVNYADHAAEGGRPPTTWPEVFVRGSDSVAPPYAPLVKPALSERFDY
jgi:2-keto-4-pentenoate hydratase/2-oxohepta-3-ene-1,7-dioic acid hydratase in catechol pathway